MIIALLLSIVLQGGVPGPEAAGTALAVTALLVWRWSPLASLACAAFISLCTAFGDAGLVPMLAAVAISVAAGRHLDQVGPPQVVFALAGAAGLLITAAGSLSGGLNVVLTAFATAAPAPEMPSSPTPFAPTGFA